MLQTAKTGGALIVDCPFMYPYHPEQPDFEDYWRISAPAMDKLLNLEGFDVVSCQLVAGILTSALARKPHKYE